MVFAMAIRGFANLVFFAALREMIRLVQQNYADRKSEVDMKILLKHTDPALQQAYDEYTRFTQDEELRQLEDARQMYLHDFNTAINHAKKEGREEGRKEGRAIQTESLLRILTKRFGPVSHVIVEKLHAINSLDRLVQLTDLSLDCATIGEFEESLK